MWLIKTLSSLHKVAVNMTLNGILRGLKKGYIYIYIYSCYVAGVFPATVRPFIG